MRTTGVLPTVSVMLLNFPMQTSRSVFAEVQNTPSQTNRASSLERTPDWFAASIAFQAAFTASNRRRRPCNADGSRQADIHRGSKVRPHIHRAEAADTRSRAGKGSGRRDKAPAPTGPLPGRLPGL